MRLPLALGSQETVVPAKYRVLVVEDDTDTMLLLRLLLRNLPLEIIHAGTGAAAVAYLEHTQPDLMFVDLNLPDTSGWKVIERMKNGRTHPTPIIVLTSHAEPVNRLI